MVRGRFAAAAFLAWLWPAAPWAAEVPNAWTVAVVLPRPPAANEALGLTVETGVLPRGTEIEIATQGGEPVGTVSPFAIPPNQPAGTYVLPLKPAMVRDGRVTVVVLVVRGGAPARAPTNEELRVLGIEYIQIAPR